MTEAPNRSPAALLAAGMRAACAEARRWMGATSPNPPVGAAALDENGTILAVAAHQRAGQDHAEAALLKLCRAQNLLPRVHTMCVTLEPCNHHGRTPPCSEAMIAAGLRRVAVGTRDPNPQVAGGGIDRLRAAGIDVIENIERDLCEQSMHAFLFHARTGKPFMTVKRAFDAAGSMIPPWGQKTFTSQNSLVLAHRLRKKADAIITGSGTILADAPLFNVRHVPDFVDKTRILAILDRRGRVPPAYLAETATRGKEPVVYQDIDSCLHDLEKRGVRDILIESGPILAETMLDSGYWAMKIDIHAGTPDKVDVFFNTKEKMFFETSRLDLESLLPI
ncbi:MAG: bifunctional diaminohydroxyphosphoribosylaminopyrimidine deaminase/5-amino-6-(5-phosphoribosylamino)uracil reductase RibD [Alphaproteobacteria bacterium]|nr:bifunctional diaminohydroxyphosphoribosylaminopyrimidine deaminase/5-amino-6-(5-phosphoribosylamino)uracil reductase RibD [Alphaproteobacteria bacterium]